MDDLIITDTNATTDLPGSWRVVENLSGDVLSPRNVRNDEAALMLAGAIANRLQVYVRLDWTPDGVEWRPGPIVQPGDIATRNAP